MRRGRACTYTRTRTATHTHTRFLRVERSEIKHFLSRRPARKRPETGFRTARSCARWGERPLRGKLFGRPPRLRPAAALYLADAVSVQRPHPAGLRVREAEALQKRRRTIRDRYAREQREALEGAGQLALDLEPGLSVSDLAAAYDFAPDPGRRRRRR